MPGPGVPQVHMVKIMEPCQRFPNVPWTVCLHPGIRGLQSGALKVACCVLGDGILQILVVGGAYWSHC